MKNLHVAIIMDGNGRWATARGLPRSAGHTAGARAARAVIEAAARLDLGQLTLYAFSADNWQRPSAEVRALMSLLRRYLRSETDRCRDNGIRLEVIGRRDRLPRTVVAAIEQAERATAVANGLRLKLAIDYSARHSIAGVAMRSTRFGVDSLATALQRDGCGDAVDLLIRTGGEQRLSDFLLWECAYAELLFVDTPWPDFGAADLHESLARFYNRGRRYGRICAHSAAAHS